MEEKEEEGGDDLIKRAVTPRFCDGVWSLILKGEDGWRCSPIFSGVPFLLMETDVWHCQM